jgi:hypothetical protein
MRVNKNELLFMVLAVIAFVVTLALFEEPSNVSAANANKDGSALVNPAHYPKPHRTPQAPANFPWNRMPSLPGQSSRNQVPPPFQVPTQDPTPTQYPGPAN